MIVERLHYEAAEVVGSEPINHPELHRALCGRVAAALDAAEQRGAERGKADGAERVAQRMRELAEEFEGEKDDYRYAIRNDLEPGPWDRIREVLAEVAPPTAGQEGRRAVCPDCPSVGGKCAVCPRTGLPPLAPAPHEKEPTDG